MLEYRAEGLCRNATTLTHEEWERCIAAGEVLQSTALAYDTDRCLRFEIAGHRARMPFAECVDTAPGEEIKDIAVLTRVGRATCFVITGTRSSILPVVPKNTLRLRYWTYFWIYKEMVSVTQKYFMSSGMVSLISFANLK